MANPLIQAFERRPGAIVGTPGAERTRRGTELGVDRILDQRYRILEPIGTGGSSQVYLAQDTALGREVAVKVLDPHAASDNTLRKLFVTPHEAVLTGLVLFVVGAGAGVFGSAFAVRRFLTV